MTSTPDDSIEVIWAHHLTHVGQDVDISKFPTYDSWAPQTWLYRTEFNTNSMDLVLPPPYFAYPSEIFIAIREKERKRRKDQSWTFPTDMELSGAYPYNITRLGTLCTYPLWLYPKELRLFPEARKRYEEKNRLLKRKRILEEIDEVKKLRRTETSKIDQLQAQNKAQETENEKLKIQNKTQETEIEKLKDQNENLKAQNSILKIDINTLEVQVEELKAKERKTMVHGDRLQYYQEQAAYWEAALDEALKKFASDESTSSVEDNDDKNASKLNGAST